MGPPSGIEEGAPHVRICLMIEGQEGVTFEEWVALAHAVERAGLDGLFRSDHYTSFHTSPPGPALDAWATICALGAVTADIRLGTLVSPATFRHPSELARIVVTADHVSNGRVELGVGAGWFETEHRQNGFAFPDIVERTDRLHEYVGVLVRSWSGQTFDFAGRFFTLEGQQALPAPLQVPHPPLIVGGRGKRRSLELAANAAREYNSGFLDLDAVAPLRASLDRACEGIGRDPGSLALSMMTLVAVGTDDEDAARRVEHALQFFRGPRDRCHVGTVSEMADRLHAFEEAGIERIFVQHPDRSDWASIELLGELAERLAA
jgi:alkanesulfonate monooxygenase SsuD/methylene tetrahydromethanopterin reductase-like flavin-dependent oxidoreductase (luciferase family)